MADNFIKMNPLYGIYSDFKKILKTVIIKYSYLAEKYETFDIKKAADLLGLCNVVFFSPEDLSIIKDGPSERRRFVDMELFETVFICCALYIG